MSAEAVILMLVSMAVLWGGLTVAIIRLNRHQPSDPSPHPDGLHRDL